MLTLLINERPYSVDVEPETPLLWVLRDTIGLTGAKFSCGIGLCGACTVHIDGLPRRSCVTPVATLGGRNITTIEGLSDTGTHPVQIAWKELDVPQCGYCQSGQIMAAAALLARRPDPSDEEIDAQMTVVCRCGTYPRIRQAVRRAAAMIRGDRH